MGLFDSDVLKGVLGQIETNAFPTLISAVLAKTNLGDLNGLVNKLREGGLEEQVKSWLGNGTNLPVTVDQLRNALGNEKVKELAEHFGVPVDQLLQLLSQHLPTTVDQSSPNGTIEDDK